MPKPKQLDFQIERLYRQASTNNAAANNINLTTGQSTQNLAHVDTVSPVNPFLQKSLNLHVRPH